METILLGILEVQVDPFGAMRGQDPRRATDLPIVKAARSCPLLGAGLSLQLALVQNP